MSENAAAVSAQGLEEDAESLSGDVTIADQVVLAALEVLYKLSSSKQHLQCFRCASGHCCAITREALDSLQPSRLCCRSCTQFCCCPACCINGCGFAYASIHVYGIVPVSLASQSCLQVLSAQLASRLLSLQVLSAQLACIHSCAKVACTYSKFRILNFGGKLSAARHC